MITTHDTNYYDSFIHNLLELSNTVENQLLKFNKYKKQGNHRI